MKINLNQTSQINIYMPISTLRIEKITQSPEDLNAVDKEVSVPPDLNLSPAYFPNITFKRKPDMEFLLDFSDKFKCAYTGRPMISKPKARNIYQKLEKRPTAQTAINLLQHLQGYMHNIERQVFVDIFSDAQHKNKRDFQDILQEYAPAALERLEFKQYEILNSTNRIIGSLSEPVAQQVIEARDKAITSIDNGTFERKDPLKKIKAIKAKGKDLQQIIKIYRKWYGLPASSKDVDAFIVQYSKKSHIQIAKRLISSAVASVEHVQPHSRGGDNDLSNLILVSAQFNNARHSMPLWEFMMLNPEIDFAKNLQHYMDDVINEIHDRRSPFSERAYYPDKIKKVIERETNSLVQLDTDKLCLTHEQTRDISRLQKLGRVYKIIEK